MFGLMQDRPLLIASILEHAARHHRDAKIVSARPDGTLARHSWPMVAARAAQLAHALAARGVAQGERVATLAWNEHRHLEAYYGISCMGAVLHTVNPRLFPAQIAYILADAADTHLFVDPTLLPVLDGIADQLPPSLRAVVVMGDAVPELPKLAGRVEVVAQEAMIAGQPTEYPWPVLDERAASSLCYTSGTTGEPKGVLYSHRSTVLHAMGLVAPDVMALGARDVVMPVVPMFHVNGWGIPYGAGVVGASLVLPGPKLDPASLHRLFEEERVSFSAGVPTIWTALLQWLRADPSRTLSHHPRMVIGGTALPRAVNAGFQQEYGCEVRHAWGMSETSPLGSTNAPKAGNADWDANRFLDYAVKQGGALFGVDFRVRDGAGAEIAHDGAAFGELEVRGPWVASAYFNRPGDPAFTADGWFRTGDVVTVDPLGSIEVVDRAKDVIKSGGEWISSITLENLAMGHPAVQEAAVIAVPHPKWDERPLLLVVAKEGTRPDPADVLAIYDGQVAKWWVPDRVEFVDALPHTATGKLWKAELKRQYQAPPAG